MLERSRYQAVPRDDQLAPTIVLSGGADRERVPQRVGDALTENLRAADADPPPLRFSSLSIAPDPESMSELKLVRSEVSDTDNSTR